MARGRKRKPGKRTPSGRLSRAKGEAGYTPPDRGTERTQERQSVYGQDGSDAIGRAYRAGLLGENGQELKDVARKLFRAYWPMFAVGREKSCLGLDIHGMEVNDSLLSPDEREHKKKREVKLTETLRAIDRMGAAQSRAFHGLCININPDFGPAWLDRLLEAKALGIDSSPSDNAQMVMALAVLDHIKNEW